MQVQDPSARKGLEVITTQIDRISKLIRSLLRISRSSSDVRFEDVAVENVLTEISALLGQKLKQEEIPKYILVSDFATFQLHDLEEEKMLEFSILSRRFS
jgi:signal transduction histidine kinase